MIIRSIIFVALSCISMIFTVKLSAAEQAKSKGALFVACSQTQQKNKGSDITFKAKADRQKYKIGDLMTLSITPDRKSFVTIIDHGSDPEAPKRNNFLFKNIIVEKDQTYVFPKPTGKFDMQVSGPAGGNTFEVIVSAVELVNPDANSRNVNLVEKVKPTEATQKVKTTSCMMVFEITE